jgi:hypothetical protein
MLHQGRGGVMDFNNKETFISKWEACGRAWAKGPFNDLISFMLFC